MGEYLYTGAWQLCASKNADCYQDCFGMVAGMVRLKGEEIVRFSFNVGKVPVEDGADEFVIEFSEARARVLAEELSAVLIRSDHLHRLYRLGRLASHAIHSDEADMAAMTSELTDVHSTRAATNPISRKPKTDIQADVHTETLVVYHRQNLTKIGSISAFGSIEGGTIQIRLCKAAIRRISADQLSLDIEVPRSFGEDLSLRVREAEVELRQLRWLKRYEFLVETP